MQSSYDLQPGTMLNHQYRIRAFLGCGWEGEVYKVEEKSTGIIRAAKLFYNKRHVKKALIDYAKKLYRLRSCPVIMRYHHQDQVVMKNDEKLDFLVSDFIDGQVLSAFLSNQKGKRLVPFEAMHLFHALVKGVEEVHAIKEYHGDIHSDNIIIKRKGLGYEVRLIDLIHLGPTTRDQVQQDVYDLIDVFYEMIGGVKNYHKMPEYIKKIILGRRIASISRNFRNAGDLRQHLENLYWD
jgi:serine/threonine protein kinase